MVIVWVGHNGRDHCVTVLNYSKVPNKRPVRLLRTNRLFIRNFRVYCNPELYLQSTAFCTYNVKWGVCISKCL